MRSTCSWIALFVVSFAGVVSQAEERDWPRPPLTTTEDRVPDMRTPWFEQPQPVDIPSDEELDTYHVRDRTFHITRVARGLSGAAQRRQDVAPAAEAFVHGGEPEQTFGGAYDHMIKGAGESRWERQLYVRFEPSELEGPMERAVLRVPVRGLGGENERTPVLAVHAADPGGWSSEDLTWSDRPALGRKLGEATLDEGAKTYTIDLTGHFERGEVDEPITLVLVDEAKTGRAVTVASARRGGPTTLRFVMESDEQESHAPNRGRGDVVAYYDDENEALYFKGSGRGGIESNERLIIEDCTFVMDFEDGDFDRWDARRSAVYVEGFKEVVVRRSKFISKGKWSDPVRKTNASLTVYDSVNVRVEDCYFEGVTNWMRGHLLVFCSGPTSIHGVEVAGVPDENGTPRAGGGIWVATGVGEGKLGHLHADNPELMLYPAGPLLIEDSYIHDQKGDRNTDGIYVQSIHPFLVRNTKVENWGHDGLMDVGFRDSHNRKYRGKPLANHGAMGVVEHSEFADGWLKMAVGAGGGIVYRHNKLENVWLYPYVFDGGDWWVVSNEFSDIQGVVASGLIGQTSGWAAGEGMFAAGSQMRLYNNLFNFAADDAPEGALFTHMRTYLPEHMKMSVENDRLRIRNTGRSHAAAAVKRTIDFDPKPTVLQWQMTIEVAEATGENDGALNWSVGEGFGGRPARESGDKPFARVGLGVGEDGLRVAGERYRGEQTLTWVLNAGSNAITYEGPDGGSHRLAHGRYDLWVGEQRVVEDAEAANPDQGLANLALLYEPGQELNATIDIDAFRVSTGEPGADVVRFDEDLMHIDFSQGESLERYQQTAGVPLFVGNPNDPQPLGEAIVADYNVYNLGGQQRPWANDRAEKKTYRSFDEWREATGNDRHSRLGEASLDAFRDVPADAIELPGGLEMQFGPFDAGLTGPVGPQGEIGHEQE